MLIGDILKNTAKRFGDRTAIISADLSLSYAQLDARAEQFAAGLQAAGIKPGDRLGILLRNLAEYPVAYFGAAKAGAVSVHLPLRLAPRELEYVLGKIPLAALVADATLGDLVATAQRFVPEGRIFCAGGAPLPKTVAFERALSTGAWVPPVIDDHGPAAILFTSGTTGYPKGAIQPHHGRWVSAQAAVADFALTRDDVLAMASPMYHAAGLFTWYQAGVAAGASAVLLPGWDPADFIATVERYRITGAFAVPTQLAMLVRHPAFDAQRLRSLRVIAYGGAPSEPALIAEVERALPGTRLVQNYGQTETGPLFSMQPEDRALHPAALGRPNPLIEVRIVNEGREAAVGEVGEIATRGAHLMLGYFDDPAPTREFFRDGDGWGWTGDLAVRDADGLITLVGRNRDTIISGAVNIYPSELERVAKMNPAIADCAAFGVPDAVWGELPALAVVRRPGATIDAAQVQALFEGEIGRHKRPRAVYFVDALPYTPVGKLLRGELKKRFPSLGST